jgi:hypothetical protein
MPGIRSALCLASILIAVAVGADVLELRDGRTLEGRLRAANEALIHFETASGTVAVPVAEAAALRFAGPTSGKSDPPAGAAEDRPTRAAVATHSVQIPAGTRLRVRVKDTLDPRRSTKGDRFAALLDGPIAAGEDAVVPDRAVAYGVISAASPTGPAMQQLRLELTELQIQGRRVEIVTGPHARIAEAPRNGAPANAAEGTTARVPAGALLEFRLLQPLELQLPR